MYAATTKDEETKQPGVLADIRIHDSDICDPQGGDWAVIRSLASRCEAHSLSDSTACQKFHGFPAGDSKRPGCKAPEVLSP